MSFNIEEFPITFSQPTDLSEIGWNENYHVLIMVGDTGYRMPLSDLLSVFAAFGHSTHVGDKLKSTLGGNGEIRLSVQDEIALYGSGSVLGLQSVGNIAVYAANNIDLKASGGSGIVNFQASTNRTLPANTGKRFIADAYDLWACTANRKSEKKSIENPQEKLKKLNGITFRQNGIPGTGITFEDLEATGLPGVVSRDKKGKPESINLLPIIPLLVEEVKALREEINQMKEKK